MKVAWVSVYNAENLADYGGRGYYHPKSLKEQQIDVDYIGSLKMPKQYKLLIKLKRRFYENKYLIKTYDPLMETFVLKSFAKQISERLSKLDNVDVVFSGVCQYLQPIAYLNCRQPIVMWTDCCLASAYKFYPGLGQYEVAPEFLRNAIPDDRKAYNRASLAILASEWAAQEVISRYQVDPSKVRVVPFGANIPSSYDFDEIRDVINSRPSDKCRLLFIGGDWKRKGGDIAVRVASELNQSGLKTELTIVGCSPSIDPSLSSYVRSLGYISNASLEGIKRLQQLFAESHFFILPTRAESFGHVFCEASSFGVPSLATNVGGIPTIIKDDVNGKKFSKDAQVEEYCTYISDLFFNYTEYKDLALSSFARYNSYLSWSVGSRTIKSLLKELITSRS